ncbi:MAG: energy-coupling factor transport system permease protein [Frankiales bacterium]|nr:energy-coupling factor transport system permease protein [Frankiales bacterium]
MTTTRLARHLHPGAWWLWALCLAAAATRTTNPIVLLTIITVAGYVVVARRGDAPWSSSFTTFMKLALIVLAFRMVIQVIFGGNIPGRELVRLPSVPLPDWFAGVRIGGSITAESLATALYQGLQLAAIICCVGAANALASPGRLLKALPGALYEVGVAVAVALTVAPQMVASVGRIRDARRLRGRPVKGLAGWRGLGMPILEDALERSLAMAAAMDSRGFGRRAGVPASQRRLTAVLVLGGLLAVLVGTYGLLDTGSSAALGLPLLAAGVAAATAGLVVGSRRTTRTRYRPDHFAALEWAVIASGVVALIAVVVESHLGAAAMHPSTIPLVAPPPPWLAIGGVLVALLPAWVAPPPPRMSRRVSDVVRRPVEERTPVGVAS